MKQTTKEEIPTLKEIVINADVNEPFDKVWAMYTQAEHITKWNHASSDWICPYVTKNDVRKDGEFDIRMQARDGSDGFDFKGIYSEVPDERDMADPQSSKFLAYTLDDKRRVRIEFVPLGNSTHIRVTFETEKKHSDEKQQKGWQAILNNFKDYAEEHARKI